MTYRHFISLARRVREEAAPDVFEAEAAAEPTAPRRPIPLPVRRVGWGVAVTAVAACLALTAGALLARVPASPGAPSSSDGNTPAVSDPPSVVLQIPLWYAPGSVAVQESVYSDKDDNKDDNGGPITQAGVLDVSWQAGQLPGHKDCGGIYYYAATDETVCCTHIARQVLENEGLWKSGGEIMVADYLPTRRILLFVYRVGEVRTVYVHNGTANTLKRVTGPVHSIGGTLGLSLWKDAGRTYSLMLNTDKEGNETLLLIDLLTGETVTVAPWAHKVAEDGFFSPTGKYVVFTKGVSDTLSVQRDTVVYAVADGSVQEIQGLVRHILPDDSGLVVETPRGLVLFDGDTGDTTPFEEANLPDWYRYQVRKGKQYANDCHELLIADMLTGETTVLPQEVHAWKVDSYGRYLYYYVRGTDGVICRDIATGQEFSVAVSNEFVEMQQRFADKEIQFYLLVDEEAKTLHLSYIRYDRLRQDSAAIKEARRGNISIRYSERMQEGVTCLADFGELIEDFPDGLSFCCGDGYVYLDCSVWSNKKAYWVEDYRKGFMYYVSSNGQPENVFLYISGVQALPDDAKERTDALQKRYGLPVEQAAFDYGHLIVDGQVDWDALFAINTATDKLMSVTDYYIVYTKDELSGDSGVRYEQQSAEDLQELRDFLEFVNSLTFTSTKDYWAYEDGHRVILRLYSGYDEAETIWFGRYGGKPVVVIGGHYANCTEAQYTQWMQWAVDKARECLYPSDEEPAQGDSTTATTTRRKQETVQSGWGLH